MEARLARAALLAAAVLSLGAQFRTPNFVVEAPSSALAQKVGRTAETYRRDLAVLWLGKAMPKWSQPCPIKVRVGRNLGAGGVTSFLFDRGEVYGWRMNIQGPEDRLLDSVLPHEVTHTVFASHFRQPLPRWADEGACTTVEHTSELAKQKKMLIEFLKTGRGIPFSRMFMMKEYPGDVLPLYSQGFSLATFLIDQGGRKKFLGFVRDGLDDEQWTEVTRRHYGYPTLAALQDAWLDWVREGSPSKGSAAVELAAVASGEQTPLRDVKRKSRPKPNLIYRGQSEDRPSSSRPDEADRLAPATSGLVPVRPNHERHNSAGRDEGESDSDAQASHDTPAGSAAERAASHGASDAAMQGAARATARDVSRKRVRNVLMEWSRPETAEPLAGDTASSTHVDDASASRRLLR